ncbi:Ig-like domain-containing protein [Flavobacterium sp. PL002]|uniref:Ig-like domain-containing protein n=1 Tax=Flavobacterium sp. PL002 TaxID=1897058 RepID=UPI0017881ED5|nr:Ig-like domain-containing protein [Flavobacterium sp. PL002]MBE0390204.1 Chitodextrinase [Flavobacterium sp. PL002]
MRTKKIKIVFSLNGMLSIILFLFITSVNASTIKSLHSPANKSALATRTIICTTVAQIKAAMADAQPGDEIIINPGVYLSDSKVIDGINKYNCFSGLANGTTSKPIILRGSSTTNKTILKPASNLDLTTPVLGITGDYWIIKDLEISNGLRGVNLDTANNCQLINLEIHTIAQEALHIRSNSSYNLVQNCKIYNTGITSPGYGEGIYIGTDQASHSSYSPNCDNNTIEGCTFGPNIKAECIDIKEGTQYTIVRNCTFTAAGISNVNSADAFMDIKGGYTFVYNNTFNADNETNLASCIDFQQRTGTNSGYRIAIFNNTFNLGSSKASIPTARKKGGTPSEIHIWGNTRNPNSADFPDSDGTTNYVTTLCPSWNIVSCGGGTNTNTPPTAAITSPNNGATFTSGANIVITASAIDNGSVTQVAFYKGSTLLGTDTSSPYQYTISSASAGSYVLKVIATDNQGLTTSSNTINVTVNAVVTPPSSSDNCNFGTPSSSKLGSFDRITFNKMYLIGTGGPNVSNFKNFKINWNAATNSLVQFAYSTGDGVPGYYVDLRSAITQNFASNNPAVSITGSGIAGLDGNYWVTKHGFNLALIAKTGSFTLYFSNDNAAPSCNTAKKANVEKLSIPENSIDGITVYPNPSNGIVNIDGVLIGSNIIINNMQGEAVYQKKAIKEEKSIDISYLPNGIYIFSVDSNGSTKKLKLVISK